ncbi:MAG: SDR family oxidoreductase [Arthrobacter sp.]|nr:SDR family oxidoreductase [Arthrobacter sp.]
MNQAVNSAAAAKPLSGRVALITGAARGMGAAHARALAAQGARLVLADLDADELSRTADELRAAGADVASVAGDITEAGAPEHLASVALENFGALDVLVHNAGIMHDFRTLEETEPASLEAYFKVNVQAPYALSRAAVPALRASSVGRIVFISSQWGQVPDGHSFGYMTSKAAQLALMKALSKALVADGILVNAIAPGAIRTRMVPEEAYEMEVAAVPLGRLGEPEEIASVVAFLASDAASFMTGETLSVNGGALVVGA